MPDDPVNGTAIAELQTKTIANLRAADGRPESIHLAISTYLREGYRLALTPSELTDLFCVSTPNIMESAGYVDAAAEAVVSLFDTVHNDFRRTGEVPPTL